MRLSVKKLTDKALGVIKNLDKKSLALLALSLFFLALIITILPSTFLNTLSGDDMIFERDYTSLSTVISSPLKEYNEWTARLTNIFTLNIIFASTPDSITHLIGLPLSISIIVLTSWYMLSSFFRTIGIERNVLSGLAISLALSTTLLVYSRSPYDNFYWIAGIVTYIIPLGLVNLIMGYVYSYSLKHTINLSNPKLIIILATLSMITGLYNEGLLVQAVSLIIMCFVFGWVILEKNHKRFLTITLGSMLIGFLVATIIIKLSPGTAFRAELTQSLNPTLDHSILSLIKMSVATSLQEINTFIALNKYGITLVVALSAILAILSKKITISKQLVKYTLIICLLGPWVSFLSLSFAFHYTYQSQITNYSLFTAYYFSYIFIIIFSMIVFNIVFSKFISTKIKNRILLSLLFVMILAMSVPVLVHYKNIYISMALQRSSFMSNEQKILHAKSSGKDYVNIGESVKYFTYCVPTTQKADWCNNTYQYYYGIDVIEADTYRNEEAW